MGETRGRAGQDKRGEGAMLMWVKHGAGPGKIRGARGDVNVGETRGRAGQNKRGEGTILM